MKRLYCVLLALLLLVSLTACGCNDSNTPSDSDSEGSTYTPPQPLVYTELPTKLAAEKTGNISREFSIAAGGLYYKEDDMYGIMTFDGQVDSGAIYVNCEAKGAYFLVSKEEADPKKVTSANVAGLVDATGREIIPLQYASVEILGDRFARVAELTGSTDVADEKLTQYVSDGKTVMCTGNWYVYDLKTGEQVPDATGTKPYILFDCGGYVKYVKDDKTVVVATPDGKALPEEPIHLKNGHYAIASTHTVYDSDGNEKFTYDPNGYIPVDSKGVSGYILAEKKSGNTATYQLLDLSGKVASAVFNHRPVQYGDLFHVGDTLVAIDGTPVVDKGCQRVFWESAYGQCWAVNDGKTTKVVDKTGKILCENKVEESMVDTNNMVCYATATTPRAYYCVEKKDFSITGVALSPFVIKRAIDGGEYELVNALTGQVILSGASDYKVAMDGSILYVYAKNELNSVDVYLVQ